MIPLLSIVLFCCLLTPICVREEASLRRSLPGNLSPVENFWGQNVFLAETLRICLALLADCNNRLSVTSLGYFSDSDRGLI